MWTPPSRLMDGHPPFQYSSSSTLNSGVLNGCVSIKVVKSILLCLYTYTKNYDVTIHPHSQSATPPLCIMTCLKTPPVRTEIAKMALIPLMSPHLARGPPSLLTGDSATTTLHLRFVTHVSVNLHMTPQSSRFGYYTTCNILSAHD
ncbi:hypothetical protein YC2023_073755 [Brassica napus]